LTDTVENVFATGTVSFSNFFTNIGGGKGVELINASVTRTVSVRIDGGTGTITNCAFLDGEDTFAKVNGPVNPLTGFPAFSFTFPCCVGIHLKACNTVDVGGGNGFKDGEFCTFTQGGWGSKPAGNNPGKLLADNFTKVYPGGFVEVGVAGNLGFSMKFTSARAIQDYLPAGGTPGPLTQDLVNPTSSSAGVFGGQVLALQLNVDFSPTLIGLGRAKFPVGSLVLCNTGTSLDGFTVAQILQVANQALGNKDALPFGFTYSSLNDLVTNLNEAFDNCSPNAFAQQFLCRPGGVATVVH
jgi:hypothetical protein